MRRSATMNNTDLDNSLAHSTRYIDSIFISERVKHGNGEEPAIARLVVVGRHDRTLYYESDDRKGAAFHIRLAIEPRGRIQEKTTQ